MKMQNRSKKMKQNFLIKTKEKRFCQKKKEEGGFEILAAEN